MSLDTILEGIVVVVVATVDADSERECLEGDLVVVTISLSMILCTSETRLFQLESKTSRQVGDNNSLPPWILCRVIITIIIYFH